MNPLIRLLLVLAVTVVMRGAPPAPASASGVPSQGLAAFYTRRLDGHLTASGERFNSNALTAAHKTLPLGTRVRLTNVKNHRSVIVRVNDRGPFTPGREISVTRRAAQKLGFVRAGTAEVQIDVLGGSQRARHRRR